jgi:hypothetical protein
LSKWAGWLVGFAFVAVIACDDDYVLPPTPCDDYCLAWLRADCAEDWPHECVKQCELARSPTIFPECTDEFDGVLECLRSADDTDFECVNDRSEPRIEACGFEIKSLDFCIGPVFYRCLELCQSRGERCQAFDPNACFQSCVNPPAQCEESAMRWLDCELAEDRACDPTPRCAPLLAELWQCVNG